MGTPYQQRTLPTTPTTALKVVEASFRSLRRLRPEPEQSAERRGGQRQLTVRADRCFCHMETQTNMADMGVGGSVVVFAKCPIAGSSKTRLAPLLKPEGAALLAQAMLSDILVSLNDCPPLKNTLKVLVYAPGTTSGEAQMMSILHSLNIPSHKTDQVNCPSNDSVIYDGWVLMPMKSATTKADASKSELTSSTLGDKLEDALERTRKLLDNIKSSTTNNSNTNGAVLFLGMDSPELPMEEIIYGLQISSGNNRLIERVNGHPQTKENTTSCKDKGCLPSSGKAHLCPANDGGYGCLSVPKHAPSNKIFAGVRWSHSLTAVSQLKALTDSNVDVSIGRLMYDIDEPTDVWDLAKRLLLSRSESDRKRYSSEESQTDDSLSNSSSGISCYISHNATTNYPHHTFQSLIELNVIQERNGKYFAGALLDK